METCDLTPTRLCQNISRSVSRCADFPRKICSFGFSDERISEKPLVTKWCYDDSDIEDKSNNLVSSNSDQNNKKHLPTNHQVQTGGGGGGRLARVRVSQLSRSYLPPLRETDRRGREVEKLPGMI